MVQPQKQIEVKVHIFGYVIFEFKEYVREYQEEEDEQEKGDLRCLLRKEPRTALPLRHLNAGWSDNKNIFLEIHMRI